MNVLDMLTGRRSFVINEVIVGMAGIEAAVLIGKLAMMEQDRGGWVEASTPKIEREAGLSRRTQERAISRLEDDGLIETYVKGFPRQRWCRLNKKRLEEVLSGKEEDLQSVRYDRLRSAVCKMLQTEESQSVRYDRLDDECKSVKSLEEIINSQDNKKDDLERKISTTTSTTTSSYYISNIIKERKEEKEKEREETKESEIYVSRQKTYEELMGQALGNECFVEYMSMKKVSKEQLEFFMKEFVSYQKAMGKNKENERDFRPHFVNWLNKNKDRYEAEKPKGGSRYAEELRKMYGNKGIENWFSDYMGKHSLNEEEAIKHVREAYRKRMTWYDLLRYKADGKQIV